MKRKKVLKRIGRAMEKRRILHLNVAFDRETCGALPLLVNKKFFVGLSYGDFRFDGYCLFRVRDIVGVKPLNSVLTYIVEREGLTKDAQAPRIGLSSWRDAFESLKDLGQNIIVEKRPRAGGERSFLIGRILKIRKRSIDLLHFNAYGEWDGTPTRLSFREIGAVRFESRYAAVFSKYVGEPPAKGIE